MDENITLLNKIKSGDEDAFEKMTQQNLPLVKCIVKAFSSRGYEYDDLFQIGSIGLIKAIKRFDTSFGVKFSTYAVPLISGEIKRFLRDDGIIKVSRGVKETARKIRLAKEELQKKLGREPTIKEISEFSKISPEDIAYSREACGECASLDELLSDNSLCLNQTHSHEETSITKIWINEGLKCLDRRERQIIVLRYMKDMTQSKTAELIGISQVHVSRLEKNALKKIKVALSE